MHAQAIGAVLVRGGNNNHSMKSFALPLALSFQALVGVGSTSLVRGRNNNRNLSPQSFCDDLEGGLYGLCRAFCDAKACHVDPSQRGCDRNLENFIKKAGPDGPTMPCLATDSPTSSPTAVTCPCWTFEDLLVKLAPPPTDNQYCGRDSNFCGEWETINFDYVYDESGPCSGVMYAAETTECRIGDLDPLELAPECYLEVQDPVTCEPVFVWKQGISHEEFLVCEQLLNQYMNHYNLDCPTNNDCNSGATCPAAP